MNNKTDYSKIREWAFENTFIDINLIAECTNILISLVYAPVLSLKSFLTKAMTVMLYGKDS